LVKAALGEETTPEELGGAAVQCDASGVAQLAVDTESAAFSAVRRYLSYFPSSAWSRTPVIGPDDGHPDVGERRVDELLDIIPASPRLPYDVTDVIDVVFDAGSVLELSPTYARSIVTALGRLAGHAVAIVANQPSVRAGAVDAAAADKAARFIGIAGSFHLPVVFLADNPGVLAGSQSERQGILRASARMFAAQHRLRTPKLHVTLRKAFGFGSPIMGMNQFDGRSYLFALPASTLAAMPATGGASIAKSDAATRDELESSQGVGPWKMASESVYDDVVHPGELRNALRSVTLFVDDPTRQPPPAPVERVGHQP
jgi:acetyl-CoA carboxylase carboxyltransferase component